MGEETYKPGDKLTSTPTFVVDPIDGTTNFVHGYPYVSISLGFAVEQKPTIGVVYNPFTRVLYSAITGKGAFRTQSPQSPRPMKRQLPLSSAEPLEDLSKALFAIEWGSDRTGEDFKVKSRMFSRLCLSDEEGGAMCHGLRSFGSAALNLCAVADGGIDVYWESGCWAWDVCAGWVVLEEAGGRVLDGNPCKDGEEWVPRVDSRRYLACRKGVDDKLVKDFWGHMEKEGRLSYGP